MTWTVDVHLYKFFPHVAT